MSEKVSSKEAAVLKRARTLLKKGWCQFCWGKDRRGNYLDWWRDPRAVSFCLEAAIRLAADEKCSPPTSVLFLVERTLERRTKSQRCLTSWNDEKDRTQEQVLALIDASLTSLQGVQRKGKASA